MKMLIVSALVCAMMVLTGAAPPPDETAPPDETPPEKTKIPLVKRSTACPWGWSFVGGRCYHYVPTLMSWAGAERHCQSLGGNLASVHNSQEYHHVQKLIFKATRTYDLAWIGGSDAEENGQWFWSDGTPFNDRHWCDGEPNNGGGRGQHCMQINYSADKCWDDLQCTRQLPSVCVR